MFGFFKNKKEIKKPETPLQKLKNLINEINPERAFCIFSHDLINLSIRINSESIHEYNLYLIKIYNNLFNIDKFDLSIFKKIPSIYLLKDWFLTSDGFYLDHKEEIKTFKNRAIMLVDKIIELEDNNNDKILIILTPVINQIRDITNQLVIVTKESVSNDILPSAVKGE